MGDKEQTPSKIVDDASRFIQDFMGSVEESLADPRVHYNPRQLRSVIGGYRYYNILSRVPMCECIVHGSAKDIIGKFFAEQSTCEFCAEKRKEHPLWICHYGETETCSTMPPQALQFECSCDKKLRDVGPKHANDSGMTDEEWYAAIRHRSQVCEYLMNTYQAYLQHVMNAMAVSNMYCDTSGGPTSSGPTSSGDTSGGADASGDDEDIPPLVLND
jgi:hypothetical protein